MNSAEISLAQRPKKPTVLGRSATMHLVLPDLLFLQSAPPRVNLKHALYAPLSALVKLSERKNITGQRVEELKYFFAFHCPVEVRWFFSVFLSMELHFYCYATVLLRCCDFVRPLTFQPSTTNTKKMKKTLDRAI